jgi:hypothetical protein
VVNLGFGDGRRLPGRGSPGAAGQGEGEEEEAVFGRVGEPNAVGGEKPDPEGKSDKAHVGTAHNPR